MPDRWPLAGGAAAGRQAAVGLLLCVSMDGPAVAQQFHWGSQAGARHSPPSVVRPAPESPLPANLMVPDIVRPLVIATWRQSATFRRQCARLGGHPEVMVQLELVIGVPGGRARARVTQHRGPQKAAVQIELREPARYVESIAHELEHVLEHVDGIDLPRLARLRVDGVVNLEGKYETARARSVGRTVAREAMTRR